jgi:hypothetical protein
VSGAIRLQVIRGGLAATAALCFVVGNLLAMHHAAAMLHVPDLTGALVHASAVAAALPCAGPDLHGQRDHDVDAGRCAVLTALHHPASPIAGPQVAIAPRFARLADRAASHPIAAATPDVLGLAPKTSPPA